MAERYKTINMGGNAQVAVALPEELANQSRIGILVSDNFTERTHALADIIEKSLKDIDIDSHVHIQKKDPKAHDECIDIEGSHSFGDSEQCTSNIMFDAAVKALENIAKDITNGKSIDEVLPIDNIGIENWGSHAYETLIDYQTVNTEPHEEQEEQISFYPLRSTIENALGVALNNINAHTTANLLAGHLIEESLERPPIHGDPIDDRGTDKDELYVKVGQSLEGIKGLNTHTRQYLIGDTFDKLNALYEKAQSR